MLVVSTLLLIALAAPSSEYKCVRWTWTGDVYNRKVVCVEWVKRDCSKRLYEDICKLGG